MKRRLFYFLASLLLLENTHAGPGNLFSRIRLPFQSRESFVKQLENRISELQVQIRLAREETRQFRTLIHKQKFEARRTSGSVTKVLKERVLELESQVEALSKKVNELMEIEKSLRELLEKEQKMMEQQTSEFELKMKEVLKNSKDSENEQAKIISKCRAEIEDLRKELKDTNLTNQKKLQEERNKLEKEMEKERSKLLEAKESEISTVRKEANAAIEAEKAKLRKLVKALSEREKKSVENEHAVSGKSSQAQLSSSKIPTVRTGNSTQ